MLYKAMVRPVTMHLQFLFQFAASDLAEGYSVTVGKASGEDPIKAFNTSRTLLRLALSHSAYHLTITAFNTAGTSPAAQRTIPPLDDKGRNSYLPLSSNIGIIHSGHVRIY